MEEKIQRSEKKFRDLIDSAPDAILMVDQKNRIRLVNKQVEIMFGYTQYEILGQPHDMLLPKPIQDKHAHHQADYFSGPRVRPMGTGDDHLVGIRKNGDEFPVEIGLSPLETEDGVQAVCIVRDVTERKKNEKALQKKATELDAIYRLGKKVGASLSIDQVITSAMDGITHAVQPDFTMIYLKEGDRLIPQFIHADVPESHKDKGPLHRVGECLCGLAALESTPVYSKNIHTDHRCTWVECKEAGVHSFTALPLIGKEGLIGILSMASYSARDFSLQGEYLEILAGQVALAIENALFYQRILNQAAELEQTVKKRTAQLLEAKDRAESADRLKSAFLASMSHELRTPLNSIIGFTGALKMGISGKLNEEQEKQLEMVQNSADHLLNLINDVLDISKIEAGQLELNLTEFNYGNVLKKISAMISPFAEQKKLELLFDTSTEMPSILNDQRRVEQILINLVNNAVKFTEEGSVRIHSTVKEGELVTSVIDTGIGIASADIPHIFKAFRQAERGLAKRYEGTGLGLSICEKLADMLEGKLEVESPGIGKGSVFTFTLPLNKKS